jgi:hypothetical protein
MRKTLAVIGVALAILNFIAPADAGNLKRDLSSKLFGAQSPLFLTVPNPNPGGPDLVVLSANPRRFGQPISSATIGPLFTSALQREILTESSVVPVPSGSAGFVYTYNANLNIFERQNIGLGAIFNERADLLGQGRFAVGAAYIHQDFDEFNGRDISNLRIQKGLFAKARSLGDFLEPGIVDANVNLDISTSTVALYGIYGVTNWLDVSLLVPITEISQKAQSTIGQGAQTFQADVPVFLPDLNCSVKQASLGRCHISDFTILRKGTRFTLTKSSLPDGKYHDKVDRTRAGIGDLIMRAKARFLEGDWGALGGLTEFTFPTGQEDNFIGDGAFKTRLILLYSKGFFENRLNFHLNGGGKITTQTSDKNTLEYGATVDAVATPRLSLLAELIGSYRVDSGGLPDNFIDGAFGFKANPIAGLIVNASFRIPFTNDGLRSDLTYLVGLEYDF